MRVLEHGEGTGEGARELLGVAVAVELSRGECFLA